MTDNSASRRKSYSSPSIGEMGLNIDIMPVQKEWHTIIVPEGIALCLFPIFRYYYTRYTAISGISIDELRSFENSTVISLDDISDRQIRDEVFRYYRNGYSDSEFADCFRLNRNGQLSKTYVLRVRYKPEDVFEFSKQFYGQGRNKAYHAYLVEQKRKRRQYYSRRSGAGHSHTAE